MRKTFFARTLTLAVALLAPLASRTAAQVGHDHAAMHPAAAPREPGQSAFAAIGELVRLLDQDPSTDWSQVDLERLRQHLIDMNDVTLGSRVTQTAIPGGFEAEVVGEGRVSDAIRRMTHAHATALAAEAGYRAIVEDIPGGVRFAVVLTDPAANVARLRGLGFIGVMTVGEHHRAHHEAIARGQSVAGHKHH
jgi:hypothetical protein